MKTRTGIVLGLLVVAFTLLRADSTPVVAQEPLPPDSGRQPLSHAFREQGETAAGGAATAQQPYRAELAGQIGGTVHALAAQGKYVYAGLGARLAVLDASDPNNPMVVGQTSVLSDVVEDLAIAGGYAYLAGWAGLRVVDVSRPTTPQEIGFYDRPGSAHGVALMGKYAYVADTWYGLQVIDVSDPTAPRKAGECDTPGSAYDVAISGTYAYLADGDKGLRVVDIANPAAPHEVGAYDTPGTAYAVTVAGTYAYVADGTGGLRVVDIANPAAPHEVGAYVTPGTAYAVTVVGTYAYVADYASGLSVVDISSPLAPNKMAGDFYNMPGGISDVCIVGAYAYVGGSGLRVIDVTNPSIPYVVGSAAGPNWAESVSVVGTYAYVAAWDRGLQVVDVSNPTIPREVGATDTPGLALDVAVSGTYAYVADFSRGLRVIDVSNPTAPHEAGFCLTPGWASGLFVTGTYAYVAAENWGLRVVDVSNPSAPSEVGSYNTTGSVFDVAIVGTYAYVAAGSAGLRVLDVSNPTAPRELGAYDTPGNAHGVATAGNYAYVADDYEGLRIVDISNPAAPSEVGAYDWISACGVAVAGDYVYATCGGNPWVFDVYNPTKPREVDGSHNPGYGSSVAVEGAYVFVAGESGGLSIFWFSPPASAFISTSGGSLTSLDGRISYSFGSGSFPATTDLTHVRRFSANTPSPGSLTSTGLTFRATGVYSNTGLPAQPLKPFTVTVHYSESEKVPAPESTLALYSWSGTQWVREPTSVVNAISRIITATPDQFSLWTVLGGIPPHKAYLPLVTRNPIGSIDVAITSLEVTQAVQNSENSVPLVENRPAVVRIYAQTDGEAPVGGVSLSLAASRGGSPLPGSPIAVGPWAVFPTPSRGALSHSYNVKLPAAWLSGNVTLVATLDATNKVAETNEGNNTASVTLAFNPVSPLNLKVVPVNYTHAPTGKLFPGPAATSDQAGDWLMRSYPLSSINASFRTPIEFTGDLSAGDDWGRLLQYVTAIKLTDGAPAAQVYYALIPVTNTTGDQYSRRWGGMGWMGKRASEGTDLETTLVHEIGHNFGLPHAPCGNPGSPDPNYPYPSASIGQYGLDVFRMRLWSPATPDYTKDVMSYCFPKWFSDYNYQALYNDQRVHGALQTNLSAVDSLFIRVPLDTVGVPSVLPVYAFPAVPSEEPRAGSHRVELLDAAGAVVASHAVSVNETAEPGISARAIYAVIPRPAQSIARVRLLQDGKPVAERALRQEAVGLAATPTLEQAADILTLRWGAPESTALVRYTADGGASWTTVGLDVLGGELHLDPRTLPVGQGYFEIRLADAAAPVVLTVSR